MHWEKGPFSLPELQVLLQTLVNRGTPWELVRCWLQGPILRVSDSAGPGWVGGIAFPTSVQVLLVQGTHLRTTNHCARVTGQAFRNPSKIICIHKAAPEELRGVLTGVHCFFRAINSPTSCVRRAKISPSTLSFASPAFGSSTSHSRARKHKQQPLGRWVHCTLAQPQEEGCSGEHRSKGRIG